MNELEKHLMELVVGDYFWPGGGVDGFLAVPGGWVFMSGRETSTACCFIPKPEITGYEIDVDKEIDKALDEIIHNNS